MNYKSLVTPMNTTIEKTLLGHQVFIRRLTSTELDNYNEAVAAARTAEVSAHELSAMGVNLFISALVNEDGTTPGKKELPTAEDLLGVHSHTDLLDAVATVQRHSYGTLEEAEKN